MFVILAAALWWHAWMPGLILVAFIAWALLHTRYQGARRERFLRFRRQIWPLPAPALAALIVAGTAIYGMSSATTEMKVLPIALNVLAAITMAPIRWRGLSWPAMRTARARPPTSAHTRPVTPSR